MESNETLKGTFTRIIYKSDSYMVAVFKTDDGSITVTGPSFDVDEKNKYIISGEYTHHPKYGLQYKMLGIEKQIPSTKDDIIDFLSSPLFTHIGKKTAEKIYNILGDDTLKILKKDISTVQTLDISEKAREGLREGFKNMSDEETDGMFELLTLGFSNNESFLIRNHFKEDTLDVLKENPLRFYLDVYGVSFKKVVECTSNLEFEYKSEKYAQALLIDIFKNISFNLGDTFLYLDDFKSTFLKYNSNFDEALKRCLDEFRTQAGILGKSVPHPRQMAEAIVQRTTTKATFSDTIWTHMNQLRSALDKAIVSGIMQGKNPRKLAPDIQKAFQVTKYQAERLLRTEMARVQVQASEDIMQANGYDKYEFIANHLDGKTCPVCSGRDGDVIEFKKMKIGLNAPPMHPNCRCAIAPYMDREEFDNWLDAEISRRKAKGKW